MASIVSDNEVQTKTLKELILNNPEEYVELVTRKTCKELLIGNYSHNGYDIQIYTDPVIVYTKNGTPGYEFHARVFKDGNQIGFGPDGSVDIERFRVYGRSNFLVEDSLGDIEKDIPFKNSVEDTISYVTKTYREDLFECVLNDLVHTIKQIGRGSENIKQGKIGRTTDTFYPPRLNNSGHTYIYYRADTDGSGGTFASWRSSSVVANQFIEAQVDHGAGNFDPPFLYNQINMTAGSAWQWNVRTCLQFDTSSIPDTNTISSATFSFNRNDGVATKADSLTTNLVLTAWLPANATSWVKADQNTYTGTHLSSDLAWSSFAAAGTYTDMTLNASGISNVSKTSYTYIMMRVHWDADNTNPGGSGTQNCVCGYDTGNDSKPAKLVVVHAAGGFVPSMSTLGVGA